MTIGKKIKLLRTERDMSMTYLAEQIGCQRQQIWNYENDKNKIPAEKLQKIAEVLNADINDLLSLSETKATSDTWAQALVDELRNEIEELRKDKANLNELLKLALQANGNFPEGDSLVPLIIHRNQELITLRAA